MTVADVGTFDLVSWSWGTSGGESGATGSGGGPGKANFRDINATKREGNYTAKLMQHASSGQHIKTVELRTQRGGDWLLIKLKDVVVTSFRANDGDPPAETFTLAFAEVEYGYSEKAK